MAKSKTDFGPLRRGQINGVRQLLYRRRIDACKIDQKAPRKIKSATIASALVLTHLVD
ncbi:hypothetical protein [Novosphingobium aerophilum]|uniref:hypothetical protein n=1 Tax=Novosphingobium aerophilum TaxID=2839843 RepID=UPI003FD14D83